MTGTIVNTIAIIAGSLLGLIIHGGIKERYQKIVMHALGLSVLFIGMSSTFKYLLSGDANPVLFIISLVIGALAGEKIGIEQRLERLGEKLQERFKSHGSQVSEGFVLASLTFCVGSMAILGSLESGIQGVHTTLFTKSVLDCVAAVIFASTLGVGVIFSAVAVFIYQGLLTVFASVIQPYLTADMIREISIIGGIIIFSLGLNLLEIKKIKTANLLPGILVPVIYYLPIVQRMIIYIKSLI